MESLVPIIEKAVNFGIGAVIVVGVVILAIIITILALFIRTFKKVEESNKRRGL